ncbi:hypothetical protein HOP38_20115 [Vibrio mediterranei]|uniref:hypothetical protein n=1 Tax=Vibrio mediterranei TaxID=689 RepID=UPI00184DF16F|nr:hypothetical protein [Vibrio mediterranei]NUW74805.1 hypothetical protein [Vibrio mediterranei]
MKKLCFLAALLITGHAQAQWDNPVDRYANEYKNHISAKCPIPKDNIQHFVYFARDREAIHNHPLLNNTRFSGAQIMYSWAMLEPEKDQYDFSMIQADYDYLKAHGKKLFIQLQDATFDPRYKGVPSYLLSDEYDGGAVYQYTDDGEPEGWVAKRWDSKVRARFAKLLSALGKQFDGKVEGINLQETAIGVEKDPSFTEASYVEGLKDNMRAMKHAFPTSTTMQYANFMVGEWLPWEDKGYLKSVYQYGQEIGVGLGAPDLMMRKRGQLNHALAMMHENNYTVPLGIAIQDGNYIGQTNNTDVVDKRQSLVPALHSFAQSFLHVNYMFWVNQEPYFEQDVLPCFK